MARERLRFRLEPGAHSWVVFREYRNKKGDTTNWRADAHCANLPHALRYLNDRLVREGYSPGKVPSLLERIELAEARVMELGEKILAEAASKGLDPTKLGPQEVEPIG